MSLDLAGLIVAAGVVGLCIGSFLNVVIHRLPRMLEQGWRAQCADLAGEAVPEAPRYNLIVPRSQCPACGHRIGALENIPVASYLFLRGRCAACKHPISARYPLVELVTAALTVAAIVRFGATASGLAACVFLWLLIALTFIDFDTQYLPDNLTLPLLWAGLLANLLGAVPSVTLREAVIGAIAAHLGKDIRDSLLRRIIQARAESANRRLVSKCRFGSKESDGHRLFQRERARHDFAIDRPQRFLRDGPLVQLAHALEHG